MGDMNQTREALPDRLLALSEIHLQHGSHSSVSDGMCAMEAAAWIAGEPHSDHPELPPPMEGRRGEIEMALPKVTPQQHSTNVLSKVRDKLVSAGVEPEAYASILCAVIDYGLASHAEAIAAWRSSLDRNWPDDLARREAEVTG